MAGGWLRTSDAETAIRQRALVTRGNYQVLPALASIGAWKSDIDDPRKPHIVDRPYAFWRLLNHYRTAAQIHHSHLIDGVGIRGEEQRVGVHQI
tara:strand:- start:1453 stop:1734 length:282 start_codon:yes stop_codon:yes gene_type:complete